MLNFVLNDLHACTLVALYRYKEMSLHIKQMATFQFYIVHARYISMQTSQFAVSDFENLNKI